MASNFSLAVLVVFAAATGLASYFNTTTWWRIHGLTLFICIVLIYKFG